MAERVDRPGTANDGRWVYDVRALDPGGELSGLRDLSDEDLDQISELMAAMARLRVVDQRLADAARQYMRLNATDMRALQYLLVAAQRGSTVTPGTLTRYLGITSASTTKMLDRLERGGHIVRRRHPTDRRALTVEITARTAHVARETVGRQQAVRIEPAARLDQTERAVVIDFLKSTAAALEHAVDADPPDPDEGR